MAEQQMDLCKHNQTGFCKFQNKCQKRHENTVCENTENCTEESCIKRHPKVCRNFNNNGTCRHKDQCAYKHIQHEKQTELNEQIKQGLLKHENDIKVLTEEVNKLRNLFQYMALELSKNVQKEVTVIETNENTVTNKETETEPCKDTSYHIFKCEECDYNCEKKITLNKHYNTKHMELKNNSDEGLESVKKAKLYCDECKFCTTNKKSFKQHKNKEHNDKKKSINNVSIQGKVCVTCGEQFNQQDELDTHNDKNHPKSQEPESDCKCATDYVCDPCIQEWLPTDNNTNQ